MSHSIDSKKNPYFEFLFLFSPEYITTKFNFGVQIQTKTDCTETDLHQAPNGILNAEHFAGTSVGVLENHVEKLIGTTNIRKSQEG